MPAVSRDHVPPKAWFARPVARQIRVPSCNACNNGRSADDARFRVALGLFAGIRTPTLRKLWRKAVRTLDHSPAMRRYFQSQVFHDQAAGRTGIALPKELFDAQLFRVVRGLYWHHYRAPLPAEVEMRAYRIETSTIDHFKHGMSKELTASHIGFDQFTYSHGRAADKPDASLWLFSFYRRLHFGVVVGVPYIRDA